MVQTATLSPLTSGIWHQFEAVCKRIELLVTTSLLGNRVALGKSSPLIAAWLPSKLSGLVACITLSSRIFWEYLTPKHNIYTKWKQISGPIAFRVFFLPVLRISLWKSRFCLVTGKTLALAIWGPLSSQGEVMNHF